MDLIESVGFFCRLRHNTESDFQGGGTMTVKWLSIALVQWLIVSGASPLWSAPRAQASPSKLKISILDGEGAINNVRQRTAREPIVQVTDENNRPVAGAVVMFALPDRGASGTFANGATSMTVTTDAQGQAVATGLRPNTVPGEMQIRVSASHQGQTASATITQTNAVGLATAGASGGKIAAIVAVIGAGAAGGIIAATRGKSSSPTPTPTPTPVPTPTVISAGTPTISPPR
jgi:hypothetical protein